MNKSTDSVTLVNGHGFEFDGKTGTERRLAERWRR